MTSFYRPILKKALKISFKNKWLWVLGFCAAFIGNGGVYEALLRSFGNISDGRSVFYTLKEYSESGILGMMSWAKLHALWTTDMSAFGMSIFTMLVLLALLALLISFGVMGQAGLIRSVIDIEEKKTNLKKSFKIGVERFWPVLELNVLTKVILFGFLLLLSYLASLILVGNPLIDIAIYIASFIVFIVFGIIIYFLTIYGTAFTVLRNHGPFRALRDAWRLFRKNVMLNIEMGLILFIINAIAVIAFFVSCFILLAPFVLLYFLLILAAAQTAITVLGIIMMIVFLVILVLFGAWYCTFQLGVWAILFEELHANGGQSKTGRLIDAIKNRKPKKKK